MRTSQGPWNMSRVGGACCRKAFHLFYRSVWHGRSLTGRRKFCLPKLQLHLGNGCCGLAICVRYTEPGGMVFGGGTLGRWLRLEGGALVNEISVPVKENPEGSLTSSAVWGHSRRPSFMKEEVRPHQIYWHLTLDFPISRTVRNVCCLSHPVWGTFVTAAWTS